MRVLLIALTVASCAATPPPPVVMPLPTAPPVVVPPQPTAATVATKAYRKAEAREGHAVTKQSATPTSIADIAKADKLAREALALLISQDGHPTPDAIKAAKTRLDELVAALEAGPQK